MKGFSFRVIAAMIALVLIAAGCGQQEPSAPEHPEAGAPTGSFSKLHKGAAGEDLKITSDALDAINVMLAKEGKEYRVAYAEYITSGESNEVGQTIYARNVGNKQLGADFVPGDPRRGGRYDVTWINDAFDGSATGGLTPAVTYAAIGRAMDTWQNVQCSTIPLTNLGSYNFDFGYVQYLVGMGGVGGWAADITHAGWLPKAFFNAISPPNGGDFILGVTFTFIWVSGGQPTDIDNNGKTDVAFREIYYNNGFPWQINGTYDVETIALHEAGHGLSQAHFGKVFRTTANGKLHFSPRAVMNAVYAGVQQQLLGTDEAGHCSIWANWPNH